MGWLRGYKVRLQEWWRRGRAWVVAARGDAVAVDEPPLLFTGVDIQAEHERLMRMADRWRDEFKHRCTKGRWY